MGPWQITSLECRLSLALPFYNQSFEPIPWNFLSSSHTERKQGHQVQGVLASIPLWKAGHPRSPYIIIIYLIIFVAIEAIAGRCINTLIATKQKSRIADTARMAGGLAAGLGVLTGCKACARFQVGIWRAAPWKESTAFIRLLLHSCLRPQKPPCLSPTLNSSSFLIKPAFILPLKRRVK